MDANTNKTQKKNLKTKIWKWILILGAIIVIPAACAEITGYSLKDLISPKDNTEDNTENTEDNKVEKNPTFTHYQITGLIQDAYNQPIENAKVLILEVQKNSLLTDSDGRFSAEIRVPEKDILQLQISKYGYKTVIAPLSIDDTRERQDIGRTMLNRDRTIAPMDSAIVEITVMQEGKLGNHVEGVKIIFNDITEYTNPSGKASFTIKDFEMLEGSKVINFNLSKVGYESKGPVPYTYQRNNPSIVQYLKRIDIQSPTDIIEPPRPVSNDEVIDVFLSGEKSKRFKGSESLNINMTKGDLGAIFQNSEDMISGISKNNEQDTTTKNDNNSLENIFDTDKINSILEDILIDGTEMSKKFKVPRTMTVSANGNYINFDVTSSVSFKAKVFKIGDDFFFNIEESNKVSGYINDRNAFEYHGKYSSSSRQLEIYYNQKQDAQVNRLKFVGSEAQ